MRRTRALTAPFVLTAIFMILPQLAFERENLEMKTSGMKYHVVINHEEQYSIWEVEREVPKGWKAIGFVGSKEEALGYIEEVWTDMRPLSRRKMALKLYQEQLHDKEGERSK